MLDIHVMTVAPVDFPDSVVEVHQMPGVEGDSPNVIIGFRGGEMWHAVSVFAREHHAHVGTAFAAVLAAGLVTLGYADVPGVDEAVHTALARVTGIGNVLPPPR